MGISGLFSVHSSAKGLFACIQTTLSLGASLLFALLLVAASGCASTSTAVDEPIAVSASLADLSDTKAWKPWVLHKTKRNTEYSRTSYEGVNCVRAQANSAASGLRHLLSREVSEQTRLSWKWRVDDLIPGADITDRHSEDAPVRVVLAFDGEKSRLPAKDRAFMDMVKLISGHDMPYATLMYVWDNKQEVDAVVKNPNTNRIRKIVASSGDSEIRTWKSFERQIHADFVRAFGEAPGRLIGVSLLTDSDNTGEEAVGYYADLKLAN